MCSLTVSTDKFMKVMEKVDVTNQSESSKVSEGHEEGNDVQKDAVNDINPSSAQPATDGIGKKKNKKKEEKEIGKMEIFSVNFVILLAFVLVSRTSVEGSPD